MKKMKRTRGVTRERLGWIGPTGMVPFAAFVGTLAALNPMPGQGQGVYVGEEICPPGQVVGDLGISGLDCVGECSVTLSEDGKEEVWSFSAEPRVFQIEAGSSVDGVLQEGDLLVAVDGVLITTREGGRRFADLEPGRRVRVSFRRGGVVREALLVVGSKCAQPLPRLERGRVVPPPPPRPEQADPRAAIATAPRVRVVPPPRPDSTAVPLLGGSVGIFRGSLLDARPRGRLGLGFACTQCGTTTNEETGQEVWFFSGPLEVTQVNSGGPAERAGIRIGDFITALDGKDLSTEAGAKAFASLTPGEAVQVTLTRRSGRKETVTLTPGNPDDLAHTARALPPALASAPEPRALGAAVGAPSEPAAPPVGREVEVPAAPEVPENLADVFTGPENLPLSYSGTVEGVEVMVRGGPISVSELRGARTIIINTEGLWVRIRVPARLPRSGGGEGGGD